MSRISYKRHRFPAVVIQHAVWLYFRFTLSLRDVEEMLAQRGIEVSYETVRCWTIKFGPKIAANLRRRKAPASPRWHLDEMVSTIAGERVYIWRAVDDEGEVMDMVVQKQRDTGAALRLMRRLLRNQHVEPETITQFGALSISCAPEAGVVAEGTSQQHGSFERTDRGARHIGGPALEIQCLGIATFHQNGSEPLLIGVEELSYTVLHRPWQGRVVGGEHPAQTHSPGFQHVMVELSG